MSENKGLEIKEGEPQTNIVVIRTPKTIEPSQMSKLFSQLSSRGFLVVEKPHIELQPEGPYGIKPWPTDEFRQVGESIFVSSSTVLEDIARLGGVLTGKDLLPKIEKKYVDFEMNGGNFLHLNKTKVFVYAKDQVGEHWRKDSDWYGEAVEDTNFKLNNLQKDGWKVYPVSIEGKENDQLQDLDFFLSIFEGKDGKVHAIAAESFKDRVPKDFVLHVISDDEAAKGGCNIADLRNGEVFVVPNSLDAPNTNQILREYSNADIIEAPVGFLDGGGGPRCSIADFLL